MKNRTLLLFLTAALLALSACGAQTAAPAEQASKAVEATETEAAPAAVTMQDIIDANSRAVLLDAYGSFQISYQNIDPDIEDSLLASYFDADATCFDYGTVQDAYHNDDYSGYSFDGNTYDTFLNFEPPYSDYPALDPETSALAEIVGVTEDAGRVVVRTTLSCDALKPYYAEEEFPYVNGDVMEETYVLNAEDYAILEYSAVIVGADGSRADDQSFTVTYGATLPDSAAALLEHRNCDDPRKVVIVLDPGTPEERSASAVTRKGEFVWYSLPEGYDADAPYADPACTVPYVDPENPEHMEDCTLYYVRKAE